MRIRAIAVATAAGVAVLGLAACGGDSGKSASKSAFTSAGHTSGQHAAGHTPADNHHSSGHDASNDLSGQLEQVYDSTVNAKTAKFSTTIEYGESGKTFSMTGSGVMQFQPLAEQMTMRVEGETLQTIVIGNTAYLKEPGQGWQKSNVGELSDSWGDPTQTLSYLRGVSSDVTKTGTDTIRGVPATGYRATIDMDKAAAQGDATERKAIEAYEKAVGSSTLPVEVWLDGQGRLVREHESVTLTSDGHKVSTDTTVDLYDYGTPVSISAPE
jgi:hypothetical protein